MAEREFLNQMQQASDAMAPTARLRLVLDELIAMVDTRVISFRETPGSASTVGLFRNGALWGSNVTFKANDLPSFVHELTHARCILCYRAETINYAPGGVNNVPEVFMPGAPPGSPANTVCLTTQCQNDRRHAWRRDHCKVFLDTNLNNLRGWAEVTDFSAPVAFMTAQQKKDIKTAQKAMNKGDVTAMGRVGTLSMEAQLRGQVQKSGKWRGAKGINEQRIVDEKARKKAFIIERINYGLNGMSGMGDTHNEYDTVVNQMLYQLYLWGFRKLAPQQLAPLVLAQHVADKTVPSEYLYDLVSRLAYEAHRRRMTAAGILNGAAPTILAPAVVINPPT